MNLFFQERIIFELPHAELVYYPHFYSEENANRHFETLKTQTQWQQDDITVFGKTYLQPRLTALYSETNAPYSYSNIVMHPKPFSPLLKNIKNEVENASDNQFNTVLLNLYRNGTDSNGWHADNEKSLGKNPVIASVSFGSARPFHFKHRTLKTERHQMLLAHGSLLVMSGEMQHHWLHQIAKTKKDVNERINLTFRKLVEI